MEVVKKVFDAAMVLRLSSRRDNRGRMTVACSEEELENVGLATPGTQEEAGANLADTGLTFTPRETRTYLMERRGTFFGIHYREEADPLAKLVSVASGRGMDFLVDLRPESPTYLAWESLELSAENALAVYVPAGIGHAFISLEDNTVQVFLLDACGANGRSKQLNYKEPRIGLELPIEVTEISDYDAAAPYLE